MSSLTTQNVAIGNPEALEQLFFISQPSPPNGSVTIGKFNHYGGVIPLITIDNQGNIDAKSYTQNGSPLETGSQEVRNHGKQFFTASGTFTVPEGVTKVWVSMCGGGGASGGYLFAVNGEASSFGSYITCSGGGGGGGSRGLSGSPGVRGGDGGTPGQYGSRSAPASGGNGGHCLFGTGGSGGTTSRRYPTVSSGYGAGGASGYKTDIKDNVLLYSGGGGAAAVFKQEVTVTPGEEINVTIGAGGNGGGSTYWHVGSGSPGMCLVEW